MELPNRFGSLQNASGTAFFPPYSLEHHLLDNQQGISMPYKSPDQLAIRYTKVLYTVRQGKGIGAASFQKPEAI